MNVQCAEYVCYPLVCVNWDLEEGVCEQPVAGAAVASHGYDGSGPFHLIAANGQASASNKQIHTRNKWL